MNKIEVLKRERDGLDVREAIEGYARSGWQSITEDDVQRLKWYGLFLRNPTPGFFMIRVRIPGGRTASYQIRALADLARTYGNGEIDVTTRQQIQLRHLRIEDVPAVFAKMEAVGLASLQTGMDNVRNIMTCPVASLGPDEILDATPLVDALTQELVGRKTFSNLPRKFNIAITGCPHNCLHTETQDLALVPAWREESGRVHGFNVSAGGKLGSGGYRIATPLDIFVTAPEVVELCRTIVEIFRDCGPRDSRTSSRLAFLLDDWGEERFRVEIERRLNRSLRSAGTDARKGSSNDHVGIYRQKQPAMNYVGLKIPVGRLTGDDLEHIAAVAERYGNGDVRLSPSQTIIIPNVPDRRVGDLAEDSVVRRFAYNPSPLMKGLVSCVGNDYCNLAVIETKRRALETARALVSRLGDGLKPIAMHWSGCPAGCGNHLVADIGLLGKKAKIDGRVVDAVDVYVGGRSGPDPRPAVKLMEDVPCDRLSGVLEGLVVYHAREKMHRRSTPGPSARRPTSSDRPAGGKPAGTSTTTDSRRPSSSGSDPLAAPCETRNVLS